MVPAKFVPRTVAMLADSCSQFPHFGDQLLSRYVFEVRIHLGSPSRIDR
jgi:hypothetical protein